MKQNTLTTNFNSFNIDSLPIEDQELINAAKSACHTAYAPYSGFAVGAAIRLETGRIVTGSNQENAAYPSGLCAERVAFFNAASQYKGVEVKKIVITAMSPNSHKYKPVSPCGACRQVMLEYEQLQQKNIEIIFSTDLSWVQLPSVSSLLPFSFDKNALK